MEWTPGRHTTNTDLRRTAGVGLEGREATSFISLKSESINLVSPADKRCTVSRKVKINNKRNNVEFSLQIEIFERGELDQIYIVVKKYTTESKIQR